MVQVAEQEQVAALTEPAPARGFERAGRPAARRPRRERRTAKKLVGYTPEEFAEVCAQARRCGMPPARFIREVSLGAVVRPRRTEAADALVRELARIGTSLAELRRGIGRDAAAAGGAPGATASEAKLDAALAALDAALDRIG